MTTKASGKTYRFTLTLDGMDELSVGVVDRLYEAGCDDATLCTRCRTHFAMFHRKAASANEAIDSAIEDIEGAGVGLRVVGVEPEPPSSD